MTLEERLALAREIAARTPPRFVIDNSREEARRMRFEKAKEPEHGHQEEAQIAVYFLPPCLQADACRLGLVAKGPIGSSSPW